MGFCRSCSAARGTSLYKKLPERVAQLGGTPMPMSAEEFGKLLVDETAKWAKVVKFANIPVE